MRKIIVFLFIIGMLVGSLIIIGYLYLTNNNIANRNIELKASPTLPIKFLTWKDQTNITFDYPQDLTVDPHDEDQENYAHIELTNISHPGRIIVWLKDSKYTDNNDYIKKNKISNYIDSNLAKSSSVKELINENGINRTIITFIKDDYLYQVEAELSDSEYWSNVLSKITDTFSLAEVDPGNKVDQDNFNTSDSLENIPFEEEYIE